MQSLYVFIFLIVVMFSMDGQAQKYTRTINTKADFEKFSGLPLSQKYGQVSAVKVVYDLRSEKVYFINANYFKYHHEFCCSVLNYNVELSYYNLVNYSNHPKRRFLLANINYFNSLNEYALEISSVDLMSNSDILKLYQVVSESVFPEMNLKFFLNNSRLQREKVILSTKLPLLNSGDVYKNLNYQAISRKNGCGRLKFIDNLETEIDGILPEDIIVINQTPLYLPWVNGIIVSEFQTPLSHLSILGQNRKIPIAAYKKAFGDSVLRNFENQKVCFTVYADTFRMYRIDKLIEKHGSQKQIKLESNLSVQALVNIGNLDRKSYAWAGNKASNFARLYKLSKEFDFKTPESAFVIPFYHYHAHVSGSKAHILIDSLLTFKDKFTTNDSLKAMLKSIRKEIKKTQIDSLLLLEVNEKIKSLGDYTRIRFRSSTNAEDADGFSGAGLYTSKTGIVGDSVKTIEKAIKKVWASLWSFEAFKERELYSINHQNVYMGVLVHRSFPNEAVNGVAITKNLYREDGYGFVVNAQLGNASVVKPDSGVVCDQFVCYPDRIDKIYENKNSVDILTLSSLNGNNLVMYENEIQNLADKLESIKHYYFYHSRGRGNKDYTKFAVDVEFKLEGINRELYIKQVRLYND